MPDYIKIIKFFDEYIAHYKEFLKFEYSKLDMINSHEIQKLSSSLSVEQALIMKTNAFEQKRIMVLGEHSGMTFAEIAENAPDEYRRKLTKQHKDLADTVYRMKELNDSASVIVSERLKRIQRRTAELDTYNGRGDVRREHASTFVAKT